MAYGNTLVHQEKTNIQIKHTEKGKEFYDKVTKNNFQ